MSKKNFFEELNERIAKLDDCEVTRLILGWRASFVLARDNKFGVGFVPDSMKEAHTARPVHTQALIKSSLTCCALRLAVSSGICGGHCGSVGSIAVQ